MNSFGSENKVKNGIIQKFYRSVAKSFIPVRNLLRQVEIISLDGTTANQVSFYFKSSKSRKIRITLY